MMSPQHAQPGPTNSCFHDPKPWISRPQFTQLNRKMPNPPRITHEKLMKLNHDNSIFFERKMPVGSFTVAPLTLFARYFAAKNCHLFHSSVLPHSPVNQGHYGTFCGGRVGLSNDPFSHKRSKTPVILEDSGVLTYRLLNLGSEVIHQNLLYNSSNITVYTYTNFTQIKF